MKLISYKSTWDVNETAENRRYVFLAIFPHISRRKCIYIKVQFQILKEILKKKHGALHHNRSPGFTFSKEIWKTFGILGQPSGYHFCEVGHRFQSKNILR